MGLAHSVSIDAKLWIQTFDDTCNYSERAVTCTLSTLGLRSYPAVKGYRYSRYHNKDKA